MAAAHPTRTVDSAHFRLGHQPALDGLRGAAVWLVLLYHAHLPTKGGFLGVDLFFVLSGFLITALLIQERDATGTIGFRDFYLRRALRLLPALVALLGARLVFAVAAGEPDLGRTAGYSLVVLGYVANWTAAFDLMKPDPALGHCWSLSIEEQFYLVWPVLLWAMFRLGCSRRRVALVILAGVAASTAARFWLYGSASWVRIYTGLDTRADSLLLGCFTALAVAGGFWPLRGWVRQGAGLAAAGVLLFLAYRAELGSKDTNLYWFSAAALAASVLIAALVDPQATPLRRLFENGFLTWSGTISYGLYLWHVPVYLAVRRLGLHESWSVPAVASLQIALSFLVAAISYRVVEKPFLAWKNRLRTPETRTSSSRLPTEDPPISRAA